MQRRGFLGGIVSALIGHCFDWLEMASASVVTEEITLEVTTLGALNYATEELLRDSPISFAENVMKGFGDKSFFVDGKIIPWEGEQY